MSGSFRIEDATSSADFHHPRSKDPKHDHVVIHLDNGKAVTYNDPRRFGFMDLARAGDARRAIPGSPASATSRSRRTSTRRALAALFRRRRARRLKSALLDQKRIAGLGNIYVCEALFRAAAVAVPPRRRSRQRARRPDEGRGRARQGDPRRARGGDRGGRIDAARSSSGGRRARLFPARLRGLRSRGRVLPEAGLPRDDCAPRAIRALDVLLSGLPEVACAGRTWRSRPHASLTSPASAPISTGNPVQRRENGRFAMFRAFCCGRCCSRARGRSDEAGEARRTPARAAMERSKMLAALKFDSVMKRVFGSSNDRRLKGYRPKIAAINALEPEFEALSDEQLRAKTDEFRGRTQGRQDARRHLCARLRRRARSGQAHAEAAPFRRAADRRPGAARGRDRRDEDRRRQDAGRHLRRLSQRARRRRRARHHGQRLPRPPRLRLDGPDLQVPRPDGRRDRARARRRPAPRRLRRRRHLRHEQRIRLRLSARQHEVRHVADGPARPRLRHRRRGRLDPGRRGADAV